MSSHYRPKMVVFSARKPVIRRKIAAHMKTGRRKNQTERQEILTGNEFPAITVEWRVIFPVIAEVRCRTQGGEMDSKMEADNWRK